MNIGVIDKTANTGGDECTSSEQKPSSAAVVSSSSVGDVGAYVEGGEDAWYDEDVCQFSSSRRYRETMPCVV